MVAGRLSTRLSSALLAAPPLSTSSRGATSGTSRYRQGMNGNLTLMLLQANLADTKLCKNPEK